MEHHTHLGAAPSHGFKVGVATHAVTHFYEQLLALDFARLDVEALVARWPEADAVERDLRARFAGSEFVETAVVETRAKHVTAAALRPQLQLLVATWPATVARLREQLLPSAEVKRRLEAVGAPSEPEQIGISRARLRETFRRAYHIRRRFTVLDVAVRTGQLESILDRLFGPAGVWAIPSTHA
jgi:glycerol-1-phosphate dehydrogenase [NAD(P)+]